LAGFSVWKFALLYFLLKTGKITGVFVLWLRKHLKAEVFDVPIFKGELEND
jgi:hypothetical protein